MQKICTICRNMQKICKKYAEGLTNKQQVQYMQKICKICSLCHHHAKYALGTLLMFTLLKLRLSTRLVTQPGPATAASQRAAESVPTNTRTAPLQLKCQAWGAAHWQSIWNFGASYKAPTGNIQLCPPDIQQEGVLYDSLLLCYNAVSYCMQKLRYSRGVIKGGCYIA